MKVVAPAIFALLFLVHFGRCGISRPASRWRKEVTLTIEKPSLQIDFLPVATSVRPGRSAILVHNDDPQWMATCLRIIELTTRTWGGWYSCLVPTNGTMIADRFWDLLQAFDPDYVFVYQKTMRDIQIAQPEIYQQTVERRLAEIMTQHPDTDEEYHRQSIERHLPQASLPLPQISDELYQTMLKRLRPFAAKKGDILRSISARPKKQLYSLTLLETAMKAAASVPEVIDLDLQVSPPLQLMTYSMTGKLYPEFIETVNEKHPYVASETMSAQRLRDFLPFLWGGEQHTEQQQLKRLSLLHCERYFPPGCFSVEEPALVVVGETLEDFCLYHSLLRLRHDVFWLPPRLSEAYYNTIGSVVHTEPLMPEGEEFIYPVLAFNIASQAVEGKVLFTSCSLADEEVQRLGEAVATFAAQGSGESSAFSVEITHDFHQMATFPFRLYERNNAPRRNTEQFFRDESVNFVTPKPKNFPYAPSFGFNWITDVKIKGYDPPRQAAFSP